VTNRDNDTNLTRSSICLIAAATRKPQGLQYLLIATDCRIAEAYHIAANRTEEKLDE
jgi:hypothetical protein